MTPTATVPHLGKIASKDITGGDRRRDGRAGYRLRGVPRLPVSCCGGRLGSAPGGRGQKQPSRDRARTGDCPQAFRGVQGAGGSGGPPAPTSQSSDARSEEHTSELQSLMRISYAVFCLKKKK